MCGFKNDHFPGSQPVSLVCSPEENTLKYLSEEEYMTSWKADGVRYSFLYCHTFFSFFRYLVLIEDKGKVYAFDRDNSCYLIPNVSFPHEKERRHVTNTLIDSEMIIEHVEIEGKEVKLYRLLIYDIIIYEVITIYTYRACLIIVHLCNCFMAKSSKRWLIGLMGRVLVIYVIGAGSIPSSSKFIFANHK